MAVIQHSHQFDFSLVLLSVLISIDYCKEPEMREEISSEIFNILHFNMLKKEPYLSKQVLFQSFLLLGNRLSILLVNGGNSSWVRVRGRNENDFTLIHLLIPLTFIRSDSTYKKGSGFSLRQCCGWKILHQIALSLLYQICLMVLIDSWVVHSMNSILLHSTLQQRHTMMVDVRV